MERGVEGSGREGREWERVRKGEGKERGEGR